MKKQSKIHTVRLGPREENMLYQTAEALGRSRSDVLREAVAVYCAQIQTSHRSPYEAIASTIGCARSGRKDLSSKVHEYFRKALHERRKKHAD